MQQLPTPFASTSQMPPASLVGREDLIADVVEGLENRPGDPMRLTIFVGPAGSGKTALLTTLSDVAQSLGWMCASTSAGPTMLEEILKQLCAKGGQPLPGLGCTRTWRSKVTAVVGELNERGHGVLFTVDDVGPHVEAPEVFADAYQHLVRERRDVTMLFAGVPSAVDALLTEGRATFLRRAFQRELRPCTMHTSGNDVDSA